MQGEADITALLQSWEDGAPGALERLTPLVYDELHRIASRQFAREARNHTLQPTAVVHELFLDLMDRRQVRWQDRSHFFGFAARQMRRILVDHARRRKAGKRGGGAAGCRSSLSKSCLLSSTCPTTACCISTRRWRIWRGSTPRAAGWWRCDSLAV